MNPTFICWSGSLALRAAVISFAGDAAFIQRCQVHKIRNVAEYLPEAQRPGVKFRMRAAYLQPEVVDAKNALYKLHDELMEVNPSAAGSLAKGLEETLTVTELRLTPRLRQTLSSTNAIESSFSVVGKICTQVKRWQGSDHRLRWVASALLFAESRWNKLHGYRHMPVLVNALSWLIGSESERPPQPLRLDNGFQSPLTFNGTPDILVSLDRVNSLDAPAMKCIVY
jgi:transposase-like protein